MIKILFPDIATIVGFKTLLARRAKELETSIQMATELTETSTKECVREMSRHTVEKITALKKLLEDLNSATTANSLNTPAIAKVFYECNIISLYEDVREASKTFPCLAQILEQIFEGSVDNA